MCFWGQISITVSMTGCYYHNPLFNFYTVLQHLYSESHTECRQAYWPPWCTNTCIEQNIPIHLLFDRIFQFLVSIDRVYLGPHIRKSLEWCKSLQVSHIFHSVPTLGGLLWVSNGDCLFSSVLILHPPSVTPDPISLSLLSFSPRIFSLDPAYFCGAHPLCTIPFQFCLLLHILVAIIFLLIPCCFFGISKGQVTLFLVLDYLLIPSHRTAWFYCSQCQVELTSTWNPHTPCMHGYIKTETYLRLEQRPPTRRP